MSDKSKKGRGKKHGDAAPADAADGPAAETPRPKIRGRAAAAAGAPDPVSTGPAPDPSVPDVYAPGVPDHPPGTAPVEAGHPAGVPEMRAPEAPGADADEALVTEDGGAIGGVIGRVRELLHVGRKAAPNEPPNDAPDAASLGAPAVHRPTRDARVGLFVGREWSFPPEFLKAVERRDAGVVAEFAKIGAPRYDDAPAYDLLIDRISHEVPVYRTYLKQAALRGAAVVNNPFMWSADDKFFGASLADRLGVASPKTVVLPNREYVPGIVPSESLRNMIYPLDWQGIVDYVGMPCILKDAHGGGWKEVYVCRTMQDLLHHYNTSGLLTMIVQEFIEFEHFVRCLVIGRDDVLPMRYDPRQRKYIVDHAHLSADLGAKIVRDARALCNALGYDMNSMEFAIRGGVPYAIDFMNPAPDMDVNSLTPTYFEWAVEHMADMAVRLATAVRDGGHRRVDPAWSSVFGGAAAAGVGPDAGRPA